MNYEWLLICFTAFAAAILTFFSGFGLGTILSPVLMLFFPPGIAIGLTGIVHFLNNLFKLGLVGRNANKGVLIRFGLPAVIAAALGAWLLNKIPDSQALFSYVLMGKEIQVMPVKFIMAVLLLFFATLDLIPFLDRLSFEEKHQPLGGILSGFFGGLSGNQGALRSAFLIRSGLSKEQFIATTVILSCMVDFTRLTVYSTHLSGKIIEQNMLLILSATLCAFAGAFLGNKLLKKVTLAFVQKTVAVMLFLLALGLGSGLL